MYCNIDIDTECGKIVRQYQYPFKILQYFSVSKNNIFHLEYILELQENSYVMFLKQTKKHFVSDQVWQLDAVES